MQNIWNSRAQWLHSLGLHPDREVLAPVGQAVGQAADKFGQAAGGMDLPGLLALAAALRRIRGWLGSPP